MWIAWSIQYVGLTSEHSFAITINHEDTIKVRVAIETPTLDIAEAIPPS